MGSTHTENAFSVSADGVDVIKYLNTDDFPAPTITYEIHSTRSEPVTIRLVDPVPEEAEPEALGFHPDYGEEHWHVESDALVFEYTLQAAGTVETLYGVREEEAPVEPFLREPVSVTVAHAADTESDEPSLDARIPDLDSNTESTDVDVASALSDEREVADPVPMLSEEISNQSPASEPVEDEPIDQSGESDGSVVATLVAELQKGNVSNDQLNTLREELQVSEGSTDARIERLQSEVADLQAYTAALETFLDDHGTGEQLIADFEARLEELESTLETVQWEVSENREHLSSVAASNESLESDIRRLRSELDDASRALQDLETEFDTLNDQFPDCDIQVQLEEMQTDIETVKTFQESVQTAFGDSTTNEHDSEAKSR